MTKMIDFYNYIPEVYNNKSRDFQIFTRVFDLIENSLKFDIDTIPQLLSSDSIKDDLITHLAKKVGFFHDINEVDSSIRFMISCFPYFLRNKGNYEGIRSCVQAFLKINGVENSPAISIINRQDGQDVYRIEIGIDTDLWLDTTLLEKCLEYIKPTGYLIKIYQYHGVDPVRSKYEFGEHLANYKGLQEDVALIKDLTISNGAIVLANVELNEVGDIISILKNDDSGDTIPLDNIAIDITSSPGNTVITLNTHDYDNVEVNVQCKANTAPTYVMHGFSNIRVTAIDTDNINMKNDVQNTVGLTYVAGEEPQATSTIQNNVLSFSRTIPDSEIGNIEIPEETTEESNE